MSVSPTHDIFLKCLASVCMWGCALCCVAFDAVILMNINANRHDKVPVSIYRMEVVLWMNVCHTFCHPTPVAKLSVSIPNKNNGATWKTSEHKYNAYEGFVRYFLFSTEMGTQHWCLIKANAVMSVIIRFWPAQNLVQLVLHHIWRTSSCNAMQRSVSGVHWFRPFCQSAPHVLTACM